MNEQVKKFIAQAGAEELGAGSDLYGGAFIGAIRLDFLEKFAELIVKECAGIVNSLEQYEGQGDCSTAEYIKEHFGIENE